MLLQECFEYQTEENGFLRQLVSGNFTLLKAQNVYDDGEWEKRCRTEFLI